MFTPVSHTWNHTQSYNIIHMWSCVFNIQLCIMFASSQQPEVTIHSGLHIITGKLQALHSITVACLLSITHFKTGILTLVDLRINYQLFTWYFITWITYPVLTFIIILWHCDKNRYYHPLCSYMILTTLFIMKKTVTNNLAQKIPILSVTRPPWTTVHDMIY